MHESLPIFDPVLDQASLPVEAAGSRSGISYRTTVDPADAVAVRNLIRSTGFFSDDETAIAVELVEAYLTHGPASTYRFVFAEDAGRLAGYACHGRIPLTQASHDLYWIAVRPDLQGRGLGGRMLALAEDAVRVAGGRQLYVDTSARAQYAPTREFYRRRGYIAVAELADFYAPGDGKIVLLKTLR